MLKRIIILSIAVVVLVCLLGTGTWAKISDSGKSSGNSIMAGNMQLWISPDNGTTYYQGITATISAPDFKPNSLIPRTGAAVYEFANFGSIDGSRMNLTFKVDPTGTTGGSGPSLTNVEKAIKVQQIWWNRIDISGLLKDYDADGTKTIYDMITGGVPTLSGISHSTPGSPSPIEFAIQFQARGTSVVTTSYQGAGLILEIQYTLSQ